MKTFSGTDCSVIGLKLAGLSVSLIITIVIIIIIVYCGISMLVHGSSS